MLIPLYLVPVRMPPSQAGLFLVTQPLTRTIAGPLSGILADRFGTRVPSAVGMAVYTAGLLMLSRLGPDTSIVEVIAGLVVAGIGAAIFLSPNTSAIMGAAGRHQQGVASGVVSTARSLGIAFGVVMAGAAVSYVSGGADVHAGFGRLPSRGGLYGVGIGTS